MSIREHELKYPNGYRSDNWVVIKIKGDDPHYRVLTGTSGGYTTGDSWQMNSGITGVEQDKYYFYFFGASGSCYVCNKDSYALRTNNAHVWEKMKKDHTDMVELMPEDTDWLDMDWIIS